MSLKPEHLTLAQTVVERLGLLKNVASAHHAAFFQALEVRALAKGKVLLMENEISKSLFVLAKGVVGVWRKVEAEKRVVALIRAPDVVGEVSMFTNSAVTALVKTEEDSQFFVLTDEKLAGLAALDPRIPQQLLENTQTLTGHRPASPKKNTEE